VEVTPILRAYFCWNAVTLVVSRIYFSLLSAGNHGRTKIWSFIISVACGAHISGNAVSFSPGNVKNTPDMYLKNVAMCINCINLLVFRTN
jgi:hypothetical protein